MPGFLRSIATLGRDVGKTALTGGVLGRGTLGATIGAGVGFFNTDFENPNLQIGGILRGAAIGAVIGGGIGLHRNIGRMQARRRLGAKYSPWKSWMHTPLADIAKSVPSAGMDIGRVLGRSIGPTFRGAARAGNFAINHPFATAGIIGGLYAGGRALANVGQGRRGADLFLDPDITSPTMAGQLAGVDINYQQQALAAEMLTGASLAPTGTLGTAPQMIGPMQRAMQNSTSGLVQGLHRGRHGG